MMEPQGRYLSMKGMKGRGKNNFEYRVSFLEEGIGARLFMTSYAMLILATEVSALSTVYHMQALIVVQAYTMNALLI